MDVLDLPLPGLKLVRPRVFRDHRGFFLESFSERRFAQHGIDCAFVQDNHSRSAHRTLRGLHYQTHPGQAKLVRAAAGRVFDVAVDIRPDSRTFGRWHGIELDDERCEMLFIPVGFAHGFCVLSESADVVYKVSAPYDPGAEATLAFDDPQIGIAWPVSDPIVSARDERGQPLRSLRAGEICA